MNKSELNEFLVEIADHPSLTKNEFRIYKYLVNKWSENISNHEIYVVSQEEIASQFGKKQSAINRIIQSLVSKQLITKHPERVRGVLVYQATSPNIALTLLNMDIAA